MSLVFLCLECPSGWSFPKASVPCPWLDHPYLGFVFVVVCFFFRMGREFVVACPANERTPKHHGVIEVGEDIEDHVAEPLSLCESPAVSLAMKS